MVNVRIQCSVSDFHILRPLQNHECTAKLCNWSNTRMRYTIPMQFIICFPLGLSVCLSFLCSFSQFLNNRKHSICICQIHLVIVRHVSYLWLKLFMICDMRYNVNERSVLCCNRICKVCRFERSWHISFYIELDRKQRCEFWVKRIQGMFRKKTLYFTYKRVLCISPVFINVKLHNYVHYA